LFAGNIPYGNRRHTGTSMDILLAVFAAITAVIGLGLLWWRSRVARELRIMTSVEVSGAGAVGAQPPGQVVRGGRYLARAHAAHRGVLAKAVRLFQSRDRARGTYYEPQLGRPRGAPHPHHDGLHQHEIRPMLVEDASGKVGIDFDGAEVEAMQTVKEPTAPPGQASATGILGGVLSALSNTNSTYTRKESILPPDIPVFVLGEVQQGGLIGKPAKGSKNKLFVISHKSKEERTTSLTKKARWLLIFLVLFLGVGRRAAGVVGGERRGRREGSPDEPKRVPLGRAVATSGASMTSFPACRFAHCGLRR